MFNDKILKSVAEAVKAVIDEALKGDQHKIDKNKNGKVDAHDFKLLRKEEAKKPVSPFDWKNTPRQTAEKGEKTGHDAKKISTGTVYTKKYTKEEASQEEFNKEIKIAQDKSIGKSKAQVAKPAVQAVQNEQVEQIDELSKKTLGKYIKAARDNVRNRSYMIGRDVSKLKPSPQHVRKVKNSTTGIQRAVDRLAKEEVEQIDELSKKTLGSYVNKAVSSVANKDYNIGRLHFGDQPEKKADVKQQAREIKKDERVIKKRNRGVDRAVKRLTREEYENLDELEFTVEDVENFMQTEEFEQLDEAMLASHIGGSSMIVHHDLADHKERHKKVLSLHKNLTKLGYSTKSKEHLNIAHHEKTKDTVHGSKYDNKDVTYTHPSKPHKTMQYWTDHADRQGKRNHVVQVFNQRAKKANLPESVGLDERSLSTGEKAAMEKNVKGMKKNIAGFKERYGKDAKSVMYATATKQAKGE
jgi:hypothetical protein